MLQRSRLVKAILSSLLFFFLCHLAPAQTHSLLPEKSISGDLSLENALLLIRETYQIQLAYDPEAIKNIKVRVPDTSGELLPLLESILKNTGLEYRFLKADQVLIRKAGLDHTEITSEITTLSGYVSDKNSGDKLAFASIFHPESRTGTVSDANGYFQIALSEISDSSVLEISYLGYNSQKVPLKELRKGAETSIVLEPHAVDFVPVLITERQPVISSIRDEQGTKVRLSLLNSMPNLAGINDPLRKLQFLPGVMAGQDLSAGLKIRGAKASENMVLLDGIPLIKVDHFFGIFSAVNGAIVDEIDLYKNAFPVEYGGRTAGLIDIKTRKIEQKQPSGGIQVNNLSTDGFLEVPFSPDMGISLAGRTTFSNAANSGLFGYVNPSQNLEEEQPGNYRSVYAADPEFQFHDFNAKWSWKIDSSLQAEANYFHSEDLYNYSFDKSFSNFRAQKEIENKEEFGEKSKWKNSGYSFMLEKNWNQDWQSKLVIGGSAFEHDNRLQSSVYRSSEDFSDTLQIDFFSAHEVLTRDVNWKNEWQVQANRQLSFGYQYTGYRIQSVFSQAMTQYFSNIQQTGLHTTFLEWREKFTPTLTATGALRSTWNNYSQKFYFSPRINLNWEVAEKLNLKGFTGTDYQFLQEASHENQFGRTASFWILGGEDPFPVARSRQWMTGFRVPGNTLSLDVEFYQNTTEGIVEYALSKPGLAPQTPGSELIGRFRFFDGTRLTRGMDLILEKSLGDLTGLLSYTLSKTTNTFPNINFGDPFPAQDDRRHQFQLVSNYAFKNWDFGFAYTFTSGRPYLDLSRINEPVTDRRNIDLPKNQNYLPDYHRMDLSANYAFLWEKSSLDVGFSIFNTLDYRNVGYVQYLYLLDDAREPGKAPKTGIFGTETNLLPRTFSLSLQLKF